MILKTKSYLLGLGEPLGGSRGNPGGPPSITAFKMLYKNPLEIPKGIPSQRKNWIWCELTDFLIKVDEWRFKFISVVEN